MIQFAEILPDKEIVVTLSRQLSWSHFVTILPENRKLELKRSLPPRAKWLKSIIAFANGAGGELILGVDDKSRDTVGIENPFMIKMR